MNKRPGGASVEASFTLFDNSMGNIAMFGLKTSTTRGKWRVWSGVFSRVCVVVVLRRVVWPLLGLGPEFS